MLCALGVGWRRLDNILGLPTFKVLNSFTKNVDGGGRHEYLQTLEQEQRMCDQCVGFALPAQQLPLLFHGTKEKHNQAHDHGQTLVACLPFNSTAVEKKHLHEQDVLPKERRDIPPCARTLSQRTYQKGATSRWRRHLQSMQGGAWRQICSLQPLPSACACPHGQYRCS